MPTPTITIAELSRRKQDAAVASLPVLRNAWFSVAELARQKNMPGLQKILESRLDRIAAQQTFDELSLIKVAEECQAMAAVVSGEKAATDIGRRLRRGVYEFLLALDARNHSPVGKAEAEAPAASAAEPPATVRFAVLDIETVRRVVGDHLREQRYDEAAAMLMRVTRNQRGAELAEIACHAGVACRAAGERAAAAQCFQSSCAADPEYEDHTQRRARPL